MKEKVNCLEQEVTQLESSKLRLSYDDMYPDGAFAGSVKEFTFFPTVECNDEFFSLINFSDECDPDGGICENLVRYNNVSVKDRRIYQEQETIYATMTVTNLTLEPESRSRPRGMYWKTEWQMTQGLSY